MVPWRPEPCPLQAVGTGADAGTARPSVASLDSSIDGELLRAIPLHVCLAGWGTRLAGGPTDGYHLSRRVEQIDVFLSHDWQTPRWAKTLALLMHFNGVPAAIASFCTCAVSCALIALDALPGGWPVATACTYIAFWFVFLAWQSIRRCCGHQTMVFLDSLCIAQHDQDLKKRGILGLAGLVSKSQSLLILWSPRYCTRLWCAFELACFLKDDPSKSRQIEFAPVSMAPLLLAASVFLSFTSLTFQTYVIFEEEGGQFIQMSETSLALGFTLGMTLLVSLPVILVLMPVTVYFGVRLMMELLQLKHQLGGFSIRASECSCCTSEHCDPHTGEEMLCDRKLVFQTLKRWYAGTSCSQEGHLDEFDELVQSQLSASMLRILGSGAPPLRYVAVITLPPVVAQLGQYVAMGLVDTRGWAFGKWLIDFCRFPPIALFVFWEFMIIWRKGASMHGRVSLWVLALATPGICSFLAICLLLPYEVVKYAVEPASLLTAFPIAFMWAAVAFLYFREYRHV
ncbi:unnamed protein product [Symbiodinium natans]|uniref:Uncharacterized protein n=1 Tax=Symbiodinium natans TaxID=878477 RepID=A0A812I280_9DINO|nr:unnamed protein product [Symbiodinium natans]